MRDVLADDAYNYSVIRQLFIFLAITLGPAGSAEVFHVALLEGLAIATDALDQTAIDGLARSSENILRPPWSIDSKVS